MFLRNKNKGLNMENEYDYYQKLINQEIAYKDYIENKKRKFDFFKAPEKANYGKEFLLTSMVFGVFMASLIVPVAFFSNHKAVTSPYSLHEAKVMSCSNAKEQNIECFIDTISFEQKN